MKRTLLPAIVAATVSTSLPAAAATNLIKNGGFDDVAVSGEYAVYDYFNTPVGFEWTVSGTVDVHRTDGFYGGDPDPVGAGTYALDLLGTGSTGGIYQSFNTEVGKTYRLTFDYANNPFIAGAAMDIGVSSLAGLAFSQQVSHTGSTPSAMNWQTFTLEFVANAGTSTLFFNNVSGQPGSGMYLDSVSVVDLSEPVGVPEPATWALMIAGFGLAGTALRQRRRLMPTVV